MSTLSYAGVSLGFLRTVAVDHEPRYSDDRMDYLFTRIAIDVQAVLTFAGPDPSINPAGSFAIDAGESVASAAARLEKVLEQQRAALVYADDAGGVLIDVDGSTDCAGGPIVNSIRVGEIRGSTSCLVSMKIECHVQRLCGGASPLYQSHRWTESVTIDEYQMTRRVRRGVIRARRDMLTNADALRGIAFHPLLPGFRRYPCEYAIQTDGLALTYSITDQEMYATPPPLAVKAQGEFIDMSNDGASRWGEVRLTLSGTKYTSKQTLLSIAISMAYRRLQLAGLMQSSSAQGQPSWLAVVAVKEQMFEPTIQFRLKARLNPFTNRLSYAQQLSAARQRSQSVAGAAQVYQQLQSKPPQELGSLQNFVHGVGDVPAYCDQSSTDPNAAARGTMGLYLLSASLQDPCLAVKAQAAGQTPSVGGPMAGGSLPASDTVVAAQPGGAAEAATVRYVSAVTDANDTVDTAEFLEGGVYTDYRVEMVIEDDPGVIPMPGMAPGAPTAFAQIRNEYRSMRVKWTAERIGEPATIPPSASQDSNMIYLGGKVCPGMMDLSGNGAYIYRISGEYRYGFADAALVNYYAPVPPWLTALERAASGGAASLAQSAAQAIAASESTAIIPNLSASNTVSTTTPPGAGA